MPHRQGRSLSAERWKVQQYVPTDRRMPSSSITRRSRDTHCPICPAKRHSSSSDTAPEAPPQFVRIGHVSLPTLSRNWVELACTSKSKNHPPVSSTTTNPQRPARRDSNPRPMTWETSVFPICYCPMCCVPAVPTTRPLPPRWPQRLLLRFALSADLQGSNRPRRPIPGCVSAAFATNGDKGATRVSGMLLPCGLSRPALTHARSALQGRSLYKGGGGYISMLS